MSARTWVAEPHEAEAVGDLLIAFRDHNGYDRPSDNAMLAVVDRLVEDPKTEFLLAAVDADAPPSGVCQLRFRLSVWTASDDCWLEDLYVRPEARRGGVGQALIELALERATARGCRRIELDTTEDNAAALALYRRNGFSDTSKGHAVRDLFLGRPLTPPGG
jgi:ribosomal protein S18 acetylase RimI-like enzyme